MKVFAPGKLVLTGAYAVLEGAPAIAVAVSRGAIADVARRASNPTPEVRAALGDDAPEVDASPMFDGARKLGLGASAAILVASVASSEAAHGANLANAEVRARILSRAREAHARAQGGGSGVDVATSVEGGVVRYVVDKPIARLAWPEGLGLHVFACAESARTSELLEKLDRFRARDVETYRARMDALIAVALEGANALERGDPSAFVQAIARTARALASLGIAAGAPIVPAGFEALEQFALEDGAAFAVSGAGGGDVAAYVGPSTPSRAFLAQSRALGLTPIDLTIDAFGVRPYASVRSLPTSPIASGVASPRNP